MTKIDFRQKHVVSPGEARAGIRLRDTSVGAESVFDENRFSAKTCGSPGEARAAI